MVARRVHHFRGTDSEATRGNDATVAVTISVYAGTSSLRSGTTRAGLPAEQCSAYTAVASSSGVQSLTSAESQNSVRIGCSALRAHLPWAGRDGAGFRRSAAARDCTRRLAVDGGKSHAAPWSAKAVVRPLTLAVSAAARDMLSRA